MADTSKVNCVTAAHQDGNSHLVIEGLTDCLRQATRTGVTVRLEGPLLSKLFFWLSFLTAVKLWVWIWLIAVLRPSHPS